MAEGLYRLQTTVRARATRPNRRARTSTPDCTWENDMWRTMLIALLASAVAIVAPPVPLSAQKGETTSQTKSGRIEIVGVNYYYEVRGEGEPLLLLHGGLGSIDVFGPILPRP